MVFINDVYEMEEIRFMEEVQVIRKTITEEMLEKVYSRENYTVDESDSLTTVFFELTQRVFKAKERRDPSKQRIFNFLVNLNYVEIGLKCMAEISENLRNNAVHFINGMIIFTDISRRFMTERGALKCIVGHYHKDVRMPELVGSILFKNTEMIEQLVQNKFLHALGLATKNSNASSNANCNANYEYCKMIRRQFPDCKSHIYKHLTIIILPNLLEKRDSILNFKVSEFLWGLIRCVPITNYSVDYLSKILTSMAQYNYTRIGGRRHVSIDICKYLEDLPNMYYKKPIFVSGLSKQVYAEKMRFPIHRI